MIGVMPEFQTKKVLIIDDEREILNMLETVLKKEGFMHIYTCTTGEEGVRICQQVQPDLVVLDIMLPGIDGYQVCQQIRQFTFVPIFFLSAKNEELDKMLGFSIGGDDYITKPFSPREVAYKMKAFFRRNQYEHQPQDIYQFGDITIDGKQGNVVKEGLALPVTAKEFQILLFLAKHPNQIFSKARLYEGVWGETYLGNDNIMMVHMRHLREKIEVDPSNPKYLITVRGLGYKLYTKGDAR
ncbi:response regulator transcription factor [Bacillus sp. NPDC094106]|uniref:response regulator transcription factor n=1 Tax=Bacillus sp. NPDC094106 TaxID=3363949 RepID=UPI0037F734F9